MQVTFSLHRLLFPDYQLVLENCDVGFFGSQAFLTPIQLPFKQEDFLLLLPNGFGSEFVFNLDLLTRDLSLPEQSLVLPPHIRIVLLRSGELLLCLIELSQDLLVVLPISVEPETHFSD